MKKRSTELQRITWDQATMLGLATIQGLTALGFDPAQLRHWSANGNIHPVGKTTNGAFLFHTATVIAASKWHQTRRRERRTNV